ncbi:MAG: DNA-binding protein [Burkholderiaceae bacterium]|nr:DNA-binding protein [Burkholderiaceae bacterium]
MELKTRDEVCRELGISARGLEKMVAEGCFPLPVRIGKRAVWSSVALERRLVEAFAAQERWGRRA